MPVLPQTAAHLRQPYPTAGGEPLLAFVWQPQDLRPEVVTLARQTSTRAVFDLTAALSHSFATSLRDAGATEVKVWADFLLDPDLKDFLKVSGVGTLWAEYHPALFSGSLQDFLARLVSLQNECTCIPVTGDLAALMRLARGEGGVPALALKGSEAAGLAGSETTGILYATLEAERRRLGSGRRVILWGGLATPEAAAAFLSSGAGGVVFESLHWLTDQIGLPEGRRLKLAGLKPDFTSVVGSALGVPCRFFDKGNSLAVKELGNLAQTLAEGEDAEESPRAFARRVTETAVPALASSFGREELIPLGPEAAFAAAFADRFGKSTSEALGNFTSEVRRLMGTAQEVAGRFRQSPAALELGTRYPVIQGAMTWISDLPRFARAVAEAGGLPTIALGLRSQKLLEQDLGDLEGVMGDLSYAVNIVALPENPCLDEQLAWIAATRPPFAVIAAGDPAYARRLLAQDIQVIYLAPDEGLLRLALEAGVRYLVLEGAEAGGHVGAHSTLTLAQIALELRRREPQLFARCRLVLAGGICNRETAFRAAMLGADAVQMGTAYLATREIVATGALSSLYQRLILEAAPGATVVSGETAGLRVRSLKTPKLEAILALERDFAAGRRNEATFRRDLEALSARSLLTAARCVSEPGGAPLSEDACLKEGQFMSGAVAALLNQPMTLAELHREVADGPMELTAPAFSPYSAAALRRGERPAGAPERLAVTGLALVNSLGATPGEIWQAALAMRSGVTEVPPFRFELERYFDPDPRAPGKTYCRVGAFQHLEIDRKALGIPPQDFRTMADSTRFTLLLASQALADSGLLAASLPPERIGVFISQNSGEVASTVRDLVVSTNAPEIVRGLGRVLPLTPEQARAAERQLKEDHLSVDDTTLLGRLNCTAGGFICNRYGFMGPCFSVSAACATSLVALFTALQMIRGGIIDAALVGGGEENLSIAHYLEFSALGALAGLSGVTRPPDQASRPFDRERDGMVLGEGGGMIVIERESLARRRGARIHAFIAGMGASNSNRGMVESLAETQEIAVRHAFADAGYGPETVALVECHATATMQGDGEEVKALKAFFPRNRRTHLTSFKSQIGHTLGASGLNSLVRGIGALQAKVFPGTLNYQHPDPQIDLEGWGFGAPGEPSPWPAPDGRPRRLMVNAFGFGGANYVVHLEECRDDAARVLVSPGLPPVDDIPPRETGDASARVHGVFCYRSRIAGLGARLAVLADTREEARDKIASLEPISDLTDRRRRTLARQGVFAGLVDEPPPPLALIFAGQGTFYPGMGRELYHTFPPIREGMDRLARVADFDLLDRLFNSREEDLRQTLWQQPALFTLEYAMARYLLALGLQPQALAGHSLGELVALCLAGVYSFEDGFRIVHKRAQCMDQAGALSPDPGTMMAVNVPPEVLKDKLAARREVYVTNYNSPRQVVVGGNTGEVLDLKEELDREGYWAYPLRVSMAFHSPIMRVIREEMQAFLDGLTFHPPEIPVISNTTRQPFPADPAEIKKVVMAHLESPVHWMQNLETLWGDLGIRLFVEVGPKDTLCNLVNETLAGAETLPTCNPEGEAPAFRRAAARLYALGHLKPAEVEDIAVPAPAPAPRGSSPKRLQADRLAAIVQREINAFVLKNFGGDLKPAILSAIRREADPAFSAADLDGLLSSHLKGELAGPVAAAPEAPAFRPEAVQVREETPAAAVSAPSPAGDYLEQVIRIIMESTGYERDEIEPDMDLRQDLAIRSSRLPVIMDRAERTFGIAIRLEDFIGVRTVSDLAQRLALVAARDGAALPAASAVLEPAGLPGLETPPEISPEEGENLPLKRLTFAQAPLGDAPGKLLRLKPGSRVAILNLGSGGSLAREVSAFVEGELKAETSIFQVFEEGAAGPEAAAELARRLSEMPGLAGLVLTIDGGPWRLTEVADLLTGLFQCLRALLRSPAREFCLLVHREPGSPQDTVAAQGVAGMLLAAAQEYSSVLLRALALGPDADLNAALKRALDADNPLVQMHCANGRTFTLVAAATPAPFSEETALPLAAGDVIVVSGGARGITASLARALAPFRPRLALLGTTRLDPAVDYEALSSAAGDPRDAVRRLLARNRPDLDGERLEDEAARLLGGIGIHQTIQELARHGAEAVYYPCDVTRPEEVEAVFAQVAERFGRVDGVLHGAGVLKDSFLEFLTPEDFARVVEVKLAGALNLHRAALPYGLRFFIALSSVAAALGNVGQVNYCAANRALAAFVAGLASPPRSLYAKTLLLPPIAGAGMADAPEIRELLELKGMGQAYVHVAELSRWFARELFLGPPSERQVMLARALPPVKTALIRLDESPPDAAGPTAAGLTCRPADFPLVDDIRRLDLKNGLIEVDRRFSQERDLWLMDHHPFRFLKHPVVSGIMAVEAFLEAARLLYPHLTTVGVRQVRFLEMLEVLPDLERQARLVCRELGLVEGELLCETSLLSPDLSPGGRELEIWSEKFRGQVLLAGGPRPLPELAGFPVDPAGLDTRPMQAQEVQDKYAQRTGLTGRYRVIQSLEGTGPGVVRGAMIYREEADFADSGQTAYQYSPYLLEVLIHLPVFYVVMQDESESRQMIPAALEELRFSRRAEAGERLTLEARLVKEEPRGNTWDARALDAAGRPVMQVKGLLIRWFAE